MSAPDEDVKKCGIVKDFDWKLKLVLESNKVNGLNAPLVQLTFLTETETFTTELTQVALDKMISSVHSALEHVSNKASNE